MKLEAVRALGRASPAALRAQRRKPAARSLQDHLEELQSTAGNIAVTGLVHHAQMQRIGGDDNTYIRVAGDITSKFESGGDYGKLQTYDAGVISYGKHQATLSGGNLYEVVKSYTKRSSGGTATALAAYLPRLKSKDASLADDKSLLDLLKTAAKDPDMHAAQDAVFKSKYWDKSAKAAKQSGLKSALGHALLYDATIQGGAAYRLKEVRKKLGGKVGDVVNGHTITEQEFLQAFVEARIAAGIRQSERNRREGEALLDQADQEADAKKAAALRKRGKRLIANGKAMLVSATKTRGPTWKALVESGDLDLRGDAQGMVNLVGKKSSVRGLRAGATIEGSTAGASVPGAVTSPTPTTATESPKGETATDLTSLVTAVLKRVTGIPGGETLVASLLPVVAPSAVVALMGFGVRDENEMTNLVFWARYPEMAGKKIPKSDTGHSQAWLDARDTVVRPAIKAAGTDGSKKAAAKITGASPTTTPGAAEKPLDTTKRPEVAVPQVATSDPAALAKTLAARAASGGITVAAHATKPVKSSSEFTSQAGQYAKDHGAFGVLDGKLQEGVAMPLSESLPALLERTRLSIEGLFAAHPESSGGKVTAVPVDNLAIFTHGEKTGLQVAAGGNWIMTKKNLKILQYWVEQLAPYLSASPRVVLYACKTGGARSDGIPFAEALRQTLDEALERRHGKGPGVGSEVWGHLTAGHTTANRLLAEFERGAGDTGRDLNTVLGGKLAGRALHDAGREKDLTEAQVRTLAEIGREHMTQVLVAYRGKKSATGKTDPLQTYVREVANMGVDRVWRDISSDGAPDFSDLGLSSDAQARLVKGLAEVRGRFHTRLAQLTTKARSL